MARIPTFFSFHFDNDVMRAQLVRNMGALDGNEPVGKNEWETVRRGGDAAIKRWIDETMKHKRCLVVLIGTETASRPWVQYEIQKAWTDKKGVVGVHIHNLKCPRTGTCPKGSDPFMQVKLPNGGTLAGRATCHDPNPLFAYLDIQANLAGWVDAAIASRKMWE